MSFKVLKKFVPFTLKGQRYQARISVDETKSSYPSLNKDKNSSLFYRVELFNHNSNKLTYEQTLYLTEEEYTKN